MMETLVNQTERINQTEKDFSAGHALVYDSELSCIVSRWSGFVSKKDLIEGGLQALQLLNQTQSTSLLVDHREIHGTWADISDWQLNIWLPQALASGLNKFALIANPGSYSVMATEPLFQAIYSKLEVMIFSELQEAKFWLNS